MNTQFRELGMQRYGDSLNAMREYTDNRNAQSEDEIWFLQHYPVFTQGTSCQDLPFVSSEIELIHSDRGGQITYHGPGQLIVYFLLDIKRLGIGPKSLVHSVEQAVIEFLQTLNIDAARKQGAPGVYVDDAKIAALGFRIRKGCSYHGLSLNIDMDLTPFSYINPCGYVGQAVTQICDLNDTLSSAQIRAAFISHIRQKFT